MPKPPQSRDLSALRQIMVDLRTPETGCPWDLEQDFATIAPYTIEEAYEVADAIERSDMEDLKSELGDLLIQVVFHAQMAAERGAFDLDDVVEGICNKMIRRHPHVYGKDDFGDKPALVKGFWERQKAKERRERQSVRGDEADAGVLADIPRALPALVRATKLQSRAARAGFDWPDTGPVFDKIEEEVAELRAAHEGRETTERLAEELGDIMFVLANLGRHLGVDTEAAVAQANTKFTRRFKYIEGRLAQDSRTPYDSDLTEMDSLWDEAKLAEHRPKTATADAD